jgi:hypothetical protein
MSDHVYKTIELVGSSSKSFDDAVRTAIERAAATVRNLRWFQVTETRGHIESNRIAHWQVTLKVGFTLDEEK